MDKMAKFLLKVNPAPNKHPPSNFSFSTEYSQQFAYKSAPENENRKCCLDF